MGTAATLHAPHWLSRFADGQCGVACVQDWNIGTAIAFYSRLHWTEQYNLAHNCALRKVFWALSSMPGLRRHFQLIERASIVHLGFPLFRYAIRVKQPQACSLSLRGLALSSWIARTLRSGGYSQILSHAPARLRTYCMMIIQMAHPIRGFVPLDWMTKEAQSEK